MPNLDLDRVRELGVLLTVVVAQHFDDFGAFHPLGRDWQRQAPHITVAVEQVIHRSRLQADKAAEGEVGIQGRCGDADLRGLGCQAPLSGPHIRPLAQHIHWQAQCNTPRRLRNGRYGYEFIM